MPADSFFDAQAFNAELAEDQRDATGHFLFDLCTLADELKATTATPEACDQWLDDSCELFSAAIEINLACHRIRARFEEMRIVRRLVELVAAE